MRFPIPFSFCVLSSALLTIACSQATPIPKEFASQKSIVDNRDSDPVPSSGHAEPTKPDPSNGGGDEAADTPKNVNGAYLYCLEGVKTTDMQFTVKCQIRDANDLRLNLAAEGLAASYAFDAKEKDGVSVSIQASDDDLYDAIYVFSGENYADLKSYSTQTTYKADLAATNGSENKSLVLSGDKVVVTTVSSKTTPATQTTSTVITHEFSPDHGL